MQTIRTIFQPDQTREVHDDEAEQLRAAGFLLPPEEPAAAPKPGATVTAAAPTTPAKEVSPDGGKQAQ